MSRRSHGRPTPSRGARVERRKALREQAAAQPVEDGPREMAVPDAIRALSPAADPQPAPGLPFELTADERAEVDRILAELHQHGYVTVEQHVYRTGVALKPGTRVRHSGQRWDDALIDGTAYVVVVTEKRDSAWSRSWGMPDVELVTVSDRPVFGSRLSQLAQYHVAVIPSDTGSKPSGGER